MTLNEEIWNAHRYIRICRERHAAMIMIAHVRSADEEIVSVDPKMSAPTKSKCDVCGALVWSNELKDMIKSLAPDSGLLCRGCVDRLFKVFNGGVTVVNCDDPNII